MPDAKSSVWFPLNPTTHTPLGPPLMNSVGLFKCDTTNSFITNYDWEIWKQCKAGVEKKHGQFELEHFETPDNLDVTFGTNRP